MNPFYVSIVFIGIILVVASLLWVVLDRKKGLQNSRDLDKKKEELEEVIRDAEQMIEELNKFSDYIVSQMDLKNEELWNSLKRFEEQVRQLTANRALNLKQSEAVSKKAVNGGRVDAGVELKDGAYMKDGVYRHKSDLVVENLEHVASERPVTQGSSLQKAVKEKNREKVIPFHAKYRDVINLADKGLTSTEIARKLNMGKGEIQLFLRLHQ